MCFFFIHAGACILQTGLSVNCDPTLLLEIRVMGELYTSLLDPFQGLIHGWCTHTLYIYIYMRCLSLLEFLTSPVIPLCFVPSNGAYE